MHRSFLIWRWRFDGGKAIIPNAGWSETGTWKLCMCGMLWQSIRLSELVQCWFAVVRETNYGSNSKVETKTTSRVTWESWIIVLSYSCVRWLHYQTLTPEVGGNKHSIAFRRSNGDVFVAHLHVDVSVCWSDQRIVIKIEWTISDIFDEKHGTFQKAFNSVEKEGELRK